MKNERENTQYDEIYKPFHYNQTPIEIIDVQEAYEDVLSFRLLHVLRYIMRSPFKGSELKDLKKALFYLEREIEYLETDEEYDMMDMFGDEEEREEEEYDKQPQPSFFEFIKRQTMKHKGCDGDCENCEEIEKTEEEEGNFFEAVAGLALLSMMMNKHEK